MFLFMILFEVTEHFEKIRKFSQEICKIKNNVIYNYYFLLFCSNIKNISKITRYYSKINK